MGNGSMTISRGNLKKDQLAGKVAVVTGAGRGIGFETARSLVWLGARVVIAEVDKTTGKRAEEAINEEFGAGCSFFVHTDVGDEASVKRLKKEIDKRFGRVDILINNAIRVFVGAVHQVGIDKWDAVYRTNLRGPILLVSQFLPGMLERNEGAILFVSSSGAAPFLGCYEVFKTAQVELAGTLMSELENTGVAALTIGPGISRTEGAMSSIAELAPLYGKTVDEFIKMSENALISAEAAGAGFAAAAALAGQYRGSEISSFQALADAGVKLESADTGVRKLEEAEREPALKQVRSIRETLAEQYEGWMKRPVFEKQWVLRDFKKYAGTAPEHFIALLEELESSIRDLDAIPADLVGKLQLEKLAGYWEHQIELLKGYEKDPAKAEEHSRLIKGWSDCITEFHEKYLKK